MGALDRAPEWLKLLGVMTAVLASSGGAAVYTTQSIAEKAASLEVAVERLSSEVRHLKERIEDGKDQDNVRERARVEAIVRQLVKPEALR